MTDEQDFKSKAQYLSSSSSSSSSSERPATIIVAGNNRLPTAAAAAAAAAARKILPYEIKPNSTNYNNQDDMIQRQSILPDADCKNTLDKTSIEINNKNVQHQPIFTLTNSDKVEEEQWHEAGRRGRVRYFVALLGLTIAVVNCYAQATFCISIVEMVLPADFVFKGEFGFQSSTVKEISNDNNNNNNNNGSSLPTTTSSSLSLDSDNSCPVDYKYRDYYDGWRFPPKITTVVPNSNNNDLKKQSEVEYNTISQPMSATNNVIDVSNRFDWDASRQGLLLGAFAIGTAPLQVLGGRLAEIYGAKWVLLAGCIGTALTNLTIPILANFSFLLLILNRIIMGIAQAGMEPGLMCLLADWLTPAETGFFISMLLFAICIGFFLGSLCSSFLLTLGFCWDLTYYVAAGINFLIAFIWFFYASSRPRESKLISPEELKYIEYEQNFAKLMAKNNNQDPKQQQKEVFNSEKHTNTNWKRNISPKLDLNNKHQAAAENSNIQSQPPPPPPLKTTELFVDDDEISKTDNNLDQSRHQFYDDYDEGNHAESGQAPWKNILSTPSVWAFIICKISIRWCADVLSIELPTYLANVLHLSIKLNGILNSVSSALFAIFSFITGYLVNEILRNQERDNNLNQSTTSHRFRISKTNLRKLIQSFASFGSAIALFLMTRYDCNILFSMSMLLILSCTLVMGTGGELQIPYDMTSRYPGTLHGMACTLSVSGWLAPPLIGLILGDQPSSRYRWNIVWYLTALINLLGGLVFVLFADARPRDFDRNSSSSSAPKRSNSTTTDEVNPAEGSNKRKFRHLFLCPNYQAKREEGKNEENCDEMASYYNQACSKSTDSSPTSLTRKHHHNNTNATPPTQSTTKTASNVKSSFTGGQMVDQLSSCLYFDRELVRCRQVEESLVKPNYLLHHDSVAGDTILFPYKVKKEKQEHDNNSDNCNNNQSADCLIGRLWTRAKRKHRKKFSIDSLDSGLALSLEGQNTATNSMLTSPNDSNSSARNMTHL